MDESPTTLDLALETWAELWAEHPRATAAVVLVMVLALAWVVWRDSAGGTERPRR